MCKHLKYARYDAGKIDPHGAQPLFLKTLPFPSAILVSFFCTSSTFRNWSLPSGKVHAALRSVLHRPTSSFQTPAQWFPLELPFTALLTCQLKKKPFSVHVLLLSHISPSYICATGFFLPQCSTLHLSLINFKPVDLVHLCSLWKMLSSPDS